MRTQIESCVDNFDRAQVTGRGLGTCIGRVGGRALVEQRFEGLFDVTGAIVSDHICFDTGDVDRTQVGAVHDPAQYPFFCLNASNTNQRFTFAVLQLNALSRNGLEPARLDLIKLELQRREPTKAIDEPNQDAAIGQNGGKKNGSHYRYQQQH